MSLQESNEHLLCEEKVCDQDEEEFHRKQASKLKSEPSRLTIQKIAAATTILLLCSASALGGFILGTKTPDNAACARAYTSWSPARDVIRFETKMVRNDFYRPSQYRGPPNHAIDNAWDKLWMVGGVPLRIEDQDLGRLQLDMDKNWSRIPDEMGGGLQGYPVVFHQLHCLNTLRKATYREHYQDDHLFTDPPHISRAHQDHCIEMLRRQLMCSAEMVPTLTYEVDGHTLPEFDAVQVCRNFDELKAWTEANVIHGGGRWDIPHDISES